MEKTQKQKTLSEEFSDLTPTVEEWEELTQDEPEISFYRESIRKRGKINIEDI